jgi:transcriptional regulator with XRE-family HTH domain
MDENILNEFKKILRVSRLKAGYNYKELAKISGISDQTIRKYENDPSIDVPLKKMFHLLKSLNVSQVHIIQLIQLCY